MSEVRNVVLVHGGFVDGSGWQGVYDLLKQDGYNVSIVQNPTLSLAGDVAATSQVLDAQDGPVDARRPLLRRRRHHRGRHRTTKVAGLVYIAAFAPDKGESVNTLIADPPPGAPRAADPAAARTASCSSTATSSPPRSPPTCPPSRPRSWPTRRCRGASTRSAARSPSRPGAVKPSWYLVATDDRMIPPPAQRAMAERAGATVAEAPGSHAVYVSQPASASPT